MNSNNIKTILLVEDEAIIAMSEKATLEKYGYRVITVYTGENAIDVAKTDQDIDMILMDIDLGKGIDGTGAAQSILLYRDLPVVFLSSHTEHSVVEKTEGITSYGYIVKNSGETVLIASIKMAFRLFEAKMNEKKHSEDLQNERRRLASIIEGTNVGTWEWNVQTGEAIFNERWAQIIGYTFEEISPVSIETWKRFAHPDDLKKSNDILARHFTGEIEYYETEARMRHKKGHWVWVLDRGKVSVWNEHGEPLLMQGTHQDITERKKTELALLESEEKFRSLFNNINIGVALHRIILDEKGVPVDYVWLDCNQTYESLIKIKRDDIIGKRGSEIHHGAEQEWIEILGKVALTGEPATFVVRSSKFNTYWDVRAYSPSKYHFAVAMTDMTDRNRFEKALHESEMKYKRLAENSPAIVYQFRLGTDGKFSLNYINEQIFDLIGVTASDAMADFSKMFDAIYPEDAAAFRDGVLEAARTLKPYHQEFRFLRKGEKRWVEARSTPEKQDNGSVFWDGFLIDITERKRTENALSTSESWAQAVFQQQLQFLGIMSPEGIVMRSNRTGLEFMGISETDIIGRAFWDMQFWTSTPEEKEQIKSAVAEARSGRIVSFKSVRIFAGGTEHYIDFSIRPVCDEKGTVFLLIAEGQDITARKKAEDRLRDAAQFSSEVINGAGEGIFVLDRNFCYTAWNSFMEKLTGVTEQELLGKCAFDVFPHIRAQGIDRLGERALSGETVHSQDVEFFSPKTGLRGWATGIYSPHRNGSGEIIGIIATIRDITQRKKMENALELSTELLNNTERIAKIGGWEWDIEQKSMHWTDETYHIHGMEPGLIENGSPNHIQRSLDCYEESDRRSIAYAFKRCCEDGTPYTMECRFNTVDGRRIWIETSGRPLIKDGQVVKVIGNIADITERKQAEASVIAERDRAQLYLDVAGVMFVAIDRDEKVSLINAKGCEIIGLTRNEIVGKNWFDHFIPPNIAGEVKAVFRKMMNGETAPVEFHENTIVTAQGEERLIAWHNTILVDESGNITGTLSSGIDITENRRMENELRRRVLEKEVLLRETHHRIKNNIASIMGLLMLQADNATSPEASAVLQDAISRVNIMRELYAKMLLSEEYRDIHAAEYLNNITDSVIALYAGQTKITVVKNIEDFTLGSKVLIPLGIILNEILSNSMKYAFAGRDSGRVDVTASRNGDRIELAVHDNGQGLPEGFSADSSNGFGLMLVKMLCEQIEADLKIENHQGTRTRIGFTA